MQLLFSFFLGGRVSFIGTIRAALFPLLNVDTLYFGVVDSFRLSAILRVASREKYCTLLYPFGRNATPPIRRRFLRTTTTQPKKLQRL